jgi:hypothetical protein
MWIKKIFPFIRGKQWYKDHHQFWSKNLELNDDGISGFQLNLSNEIKELLRSNELSFLEEIKEDKDFIIENKTAKTIIIKLQDFKNSIFWIYFDGTQYQLNGKHHTYEGISYLKPQDLCKRYFKEIRKILNLK